MQIHEFRYLGVESRRIGVGLARTHGPSQERLKDRLQGGVQESLGLDAVLGDLKVLAVAQSPHQPKEHFVLSQQAW